MSNCTALLLILESLVGAAAGIGIIVRCWALRSPLRWAQRLDATMTEDGMFDALPIYGYLRRYLLVILVAGFVILLVSFVPLIFQLCGAPVARDPVGAILLLALAIPHLGTIALFFTDRQRGDPGRQLRWKENLVKAVSRHLWGIATVLLVPTGLMFILRPFANVCS